MPVNRVRDISESLVGVSRKIDNEDGRFSDLRDEIAGHNIVAHVVRVAVGREASRMVQFRGEMGRGGIGE